MFSIQLLINFYIFFLGVLGVLTNRRHFLVIIVCIEMMLLSINMCFLIFSMQLDDIIGQIFSFFILTVAAAESSIGLAIIILYYKNRGNIFSSTRFLLRS
jgi:NADH-quinone oxidoreductase subunit K